MKSVQTGLGNFPSAVTTMMALIVLVGGFLSLIGWFSAIDWYHQHFFDHGTAMLTYNLARLSFLFFLMWIIYGVGAAIFAIAIPASTIKDFTPLECIVFNFGVGVGCWHIILLVCGLFNFYYQSVMIGLCLVVLTASVLHFKQVINHTYQAVRKIKLLPAMIYLIVGLALCWLLLVRGLYPGGGGDYYTHYFYYYLEVLRNHGLTPNDVWYHFYYTKGSGLDFLAMLLMDPEMPAMVTFCYVTIAAFALIAFLTRIAARSFWPAFCAILYILFNMVSVSGSGGEFQKLHEKTSALIVVAAWAICMYSSHQKWERPALITLAFVLIGVSIITQSTGILFGFFFGVLAVVSCIKKNFRQMKHSIVLGGIVSVTVLGVFLLNYMMTGLATDQALDLTWRFANLERLNQWGVIPNVLLIAWTRHNYATMVDPYGWNTFWQLVSFMRLDRLWVLFGSAIVALSCYFISMRIRFSPNREQGILLNVLLNLGLLISTFAVLSVFVGHVQAVSYLRLSSFFFPLLTLFSAICWSLLLTKWQKEPYYFIISKIIPPVLIVVTLTTWAQWFADVREVTTFAKRFMIGQYGLADAYRHQHGGVWFGAINPAALEAMYQAGRGTRIWSMNGNAHCSVVPGCRAETIMSFKLSSRLNEILNGKPEEAKKILQSEGLNYFLYASDYTLLDLLAHSRLFNPATLSKYFTIKWTDGKTYLLTWRETNSPVIGADFVKIYANSLKQPLSNWFNFVNALPQMDNFMKTLESSPHPWRHIDFPPVPR